MDAIRALFELDWVIVLCGVFTILIGFVSIVSLIEKISTIIGKPVKWIKNRNVDHDNVLDLMERTKKLEEKEKKDVKKINEQNEIIKASLKENTEEIKQQIQQFMDNRVHDRQQSFQIQKELIDAMAELAKGGVDRDEQIRSLRLANKELLADKINQKYKQYISLDGIPSDEVEEFTNMFVAYKGVGGNHVAEAKYRYVMDHLQVLPVETRIILNEE